MHSFYARTAATALLLAGGIAVAGLAPAASADVGQGNPVAIGFGAHPRLLSTLHAITSSEQGSYSFTATGSFKVAGTTVARLPSFSGQANSAGLGHIKLTVSRAIRHTIRTAARRHGSHRTILTISIKAVDLSGRSPTHSYTQESVLTIPRD